MFVIIVNNLPKRLLQAHRRALFRLCLALDRRPCLSQGSLTVEKFPQMPQEDGGHRRLRSSVIDGLATLPPTTPCVRCFVVVTVIHMTAGAVPASREQQVPSAIDRADVARL